MDSFPLFCLLTGQHGGSSQAKAVLTVTNQGESPIAFKIKTTAPKSYCVRPNHGTVLVGATVEVQGRQSSRIDGHLN
jgi:hypothetical protein